MRKSLLIFAGMIAMALIISGIIYATLAFNDSNEREVADTITSPAPILEDPVTEPNTPVDTPDAPVITPSPPVTTPDPVVDDKDDNVDAVPEPDNRTRLPDGIKVQLLYEKYIMEYDYVLIITPTINIREQPTTDASVVYQAVKDDKLSLLEEVEGQYLEDYDSDRWLKVNFIVDEELQEGYLYKELVQVRFYQFDKMLDAMNLLMNQTNMHETGNISNYKDINGIPPLIKGLARDIYGYRRSQSAPGYVQPDLQAEFRYIPDGMLLNILEEAKGGFIKVEVVGFEGYYWVPERYVRRNHFTSLQKVVVVDRKNQNQAAFEWDGEQWVMVSYTLATTGTSGQYALVTPLGFFQLIEKRDRFWYYKNGTTIIQGYAPYAVRFSAGGYIHGVPVNYIYQGERRIDPGMQEYLHSIGTVPQSRMCVRNYTSHAAFIHEWLDTRHSAVIVIE